MVNFWSCVELEMEHAENNRPFVKLQNLLLGSLRSFILGQGAWNERG